MTDYRIRTDCRLCHSPDLERLLTLPDTPLANEYPRVPEGYVWPAGCTLGRTKESPMGTPCVGTRPLERRAESDPFDLVCDGCLLIWAKKERRAPPQDLFPLYLVGCQRCGHVQLPVVVDPKRLFPPTYPYASGTSPVFREHLQELAETLADRLRHSARVLDVACNDGTLVDKLRKEGLQAYGIDPAAAEHPDLFRAFFTEEWATRARFAGQVQCVTALNCLAHIDDMDDVVRGIRTILEPCGLLVLECGYLVDMVKAGFFDTAYHEHLDLHHLSPLVRFFRKHGMTLVDAHRIESQGGSFRAYVRNCADQHVGGDDGHSLQSDRLLGLLDEESRSQIWEGVRLLGNVRAGWGVRGVRDRIKAKAPLVVYGAPAKLCTLIHATDTASHIEYVVDDNPNKVGRFVPGTKIPILPVSTLYERRPGRVMIASWNFSEEIKRRHADLGCEWVLPYG